MKTVREWSAQLRGTSVYSDFVDMCNEYHMDATTPVDTFSMLNALVTWRGGLADGYEVRNVVRDVYGIALRNDY